MLESQYKVLIKTLIAVYITVFSGCVINLSGPSDNNSNIIADRTVNIFIPEPDYDNLGNLSGKTGTKILRADQVVYENGEMVRYIVKSQKFGYWGKELEYKWNKYLIESYFFFQNELYPINSDKTSKSLYEAVGHIDRFTRYFEADSAEDVRQSIFTSASPGAIGIMIGLVNDDTIFIKMVAPESPAEKSGLEKGMKILRINDEDVTGDSAFYRFKKFSDGDSGVAVSITVMGTNGEQTVTITKDKVDFPTVLLDTLDGFAHLQVFSFTQNTYDGKSTWVEFREALKEAVNLRVVLIDLRDNPGGSVGEVIPMCDEIISNGVIINTTERKPVGFIPQYFISSENAVSGQAGENGTYILLGNRGSASASEIMISALMEANNIPLVGDTTFGKGIGQIVVQNTPGDGMAIVTALRFSSRNNNIYHEKGIAPTYPVGGGAEALERALELAREIDEPPAAKSAAKSALKKQIAITEWNRKEMRRYLEP